MKKAHARGVFSLSGACHCTVAPQENVSFTARTMHNVREADVCACSFVRSLRARRENIEADALQNQVFFYTIKGALKKALVK